MNKAIFYHAGCPVCIDAESRLLHTLDANRYQIEIVHLGEQASKIKEAEDLGVQSVPALYVDDQVFHINYGAALADLSGE